MNGLIGLTQGASRQEQGYRDLAALETLDRKVRMDRQAEQAAAQEEAAYFQQMYHQADQLLEKDRIKLNQKIKLAQSQLRDHIGSVGGSKKDFMQNGGVGYLNNMYSGIVRSDEAIRYQENKKNLTYIMMAQEKGLGNRLLPQDLKSMQDYFENEDGATITYSGMMNEVQIPPSQNFEFGKEIHPYYVANYEGNKANIMANYKMMYPDRDLPDLKTPDGEAEFYNFIRRMGWGGTGSAQLKKATGNDTGKDGGLDAGDDKDLPTATLMSNYATEKALASVDVPLSEFVKPVEEGGYAGDRIGTLKAKGDDFVNQVYGDKNTLTTRDIEYVKGHHRDYNNRFIPDDIEFMFNNGSFALAGSYSINGVGLPIVKEFLGENGAGYKIDGNIVQGYTPEGNDVFYGDGTKVGGDGAEHYKGNYEVLGTFTANMAKGGKDNEEFLLVEAYKKGKPDEKMNAKLHEGWSGELGGGEVQQTAVVALRSEDGDIFYHKVDLDTAIGLTRAGNAIGKNNDLSEAVNMQNTSAQRVANIEALNTQDQVIFEQAKQDLAPVFNNTTFQGEAERYWGAGSGGSKNRDSLIKSFYMATDYVDTMFRTPQEKFKSEEYNDHINKDRVSYYMGSDLFTNGVVKEIDGYDAMMRDYNKYNSEELVQKWFEESTKGLDPGSLDFKKDEALARKWKQFLANM